MSCQCKMPMMPEPVATGRSMGEVLMRGHNSGVSSQGSGDGAILLLLTAFLLSILGGFIGAGLLSALGALTAETRSLTDLQRMDMKHASILHQLDESDRQFGNKLLGGLLGSNSGNTMTESAIQTIINNPNVMQSIVDAVISSDEFTGAVEGALENGALAQAMLSLVESGALGDALSGFINSGEMEKSLEEALGGMNMEELMASLTEMFGGENGLAIEEAFMDWMQDMVDSVDPSMVEEMMATVSNTEMNMECTCTPMDE